MLRRLAFCLVFVLAALGLTGVPAHAAPDFTVLVFSKTAGFRHDSIPTGITTVQQLGAANNFAVEATEDANAFTAANLARFKAVIWLSTTGDVLNAAQQTAFENYIRAGGGYVGVHAAADTEYDWAWYGNLVGAYFASHPAIQAATVRIADPAHPATAGLPAAWSRTDEWYNYRTNPRPQVHVLTTLDESTYSGGTMGADHPNTWCRAYDGGRSFYTGMGHTPASYSEAGFRTLLLGGIRYAAQGTGDCSVGTQPPPPPPPADLALNHPATASSVENANFPASNAVDASSTTRWSSAFADPQWIQVDLGATHTIDRVRLLWEAAYGSAYQIQTSANGTTWTTARSVTGGNGGEDDNTALSASGRYVRIYGTTRATQWGYSLFTFQVYGT
ncbi:ThuA domain-containing protein [Dactylosporangium sp. CA-092794]|uniref:ThuA domain-containing protein n=1 Tax=Dactylosporangium sp. CA-092794 TaxID=3239929 RepID=UPI003D90D07C